MLQTLNIPHVNEPTPTNDMAADGNCQSSSTAAQPSEVKEDNVPASVEAEPKTVCYSEL